MIKKAIQFVTFKFGDVQLLDILNFLGAATSFDSFSKAYKTSETKSFFPYEWFDDPEKLNTTQLPPYETFFSKLHNKNPLDKKVFRLSDINSWGLTSKEALSKLKLKQPPATGQKTIIT